VRWQKPGPGAASVRVTPQLVSTADGMHLWAQVYEAPLDEIFKVQSDIAQRVVKALDVTVLDAQHRALETSRPATSRRTTFTCAAETTKAKATVYAPHELPS